MNNFHVFRDPNCRLDQIPPIEHGNLVKFLNNTFYAIAEQLNTFSNNVESRLLPLNRQLNTCYANLVILEMKLNSVNPTTITAQETVTVNDQSAPVKGPEAPEIVETTNEANSNAQTETQTSEETTESNEPAEDQSYLNTYKKMLKFGVHESAVRQKMLIDGLDPSLLNL